MRRGVSIGLLVIAIILMFTGLHTIFQNDISRSRLIIWGYIPLALTVPVCMASYMFFRESKSVEETKSEQPEVKTEVEQSTHSQEKLNLGQHLSSSKSYLTVEEEVHRLSLIAKSHGYNHHGGNFWIYQPGTKSEDALHLIGVLPAGSEHVHLVFPHANFMLYVDPIGEESFYVVFNFQRCQVTSFEHAPDYFVYQYEINDWLIIFDSSMSYKYLMNR